jgi:hypothetical protein
MELPDSCSQRGARAGVSYVTGWSRGRAAWRRGLETPPSTTTTSPARIPPSRAWTGYLQLLLTGLWQARMPLKILGPQHHGHWTSG